MLIIFSGLPAVGKSTIARALAARLVAFYLRIDTIEQEIRNGYGDEQERGPTGYCVASAVARENLTLGATVILDSVNPFHITRDAYREVAQSAGSPFLEVEVICSDVQQHHQRVETRRVDIAGLVLPDWAAVSRRDYQPWNRERLVLDSATLSVAESVDRLLAALIAVRE